ncbi:MAG: macro domain-containing protein [Lachnospiraceae bacterium]|nr:macro domain-containing protein [Lachnospiraceae bacterium]
MPFQIIRSDITKVTADAIVNTANPEPKVGRGTDSAIYNAAGWDELLAERVKIGSIAPGEAAATPAFKLNAKYIIHTVGPVWQDGRSGELDTLRRCYVNSLQLADKLGCASIAFPLIASGTYRFPKDEALSIAMNEISRFLMAGDSDMQITMVVYDRTAFRLSRSLFSEVESFIEDEEVLREHRREYYPNTSVNRVGIPFEPGSEFIFRDRLIALMNEKKIEDNMSVYKGANITKGAFSKIMCGDTKTPRKDAVMGLCISMKLNLSEADNLMASAGWAFNPYDKRDQLIRKLISTHNNIFDVNSALYAAGFDCIGSF